MDDPVNFDLGDMLQNPLIEIDFLDNEDEMLLHSLEVFETTNTYSRFANVIEGNLQRYEEANQSKSTKKQYQMGT